MNHKRGRSKNQRAGCLMCKPNKMNGARQRRGKGWLGHKGFGKLKDSYHSELDLKTPLSCNECEYQGDKCKALNDCPYY